MCGGTSQDNTDKPQGLKSYLIVVRMRIRMEGFIVFDYQKRWKEAKECLS